MSDNEKLEIPALNIHTTTKCTLKCIHCGNGFPAFHIPWIANAEKTVQSLDKVFRIFSYIREVRFAGAEAFLYEDICKLLKKVEKYKEQFKYGLIVTNGTYTPPQYNY